MTDRSKLQPGTRIWYTGDAANSGGYGTIINRRDATRYGPESVDVLLNDPRFEGDADRTAKGLSLCMFDPSPGRRFSTTGSGKRTFSASSATPPGGVPPRGISSWSV